MVIFLSITFPMLRPILENESVFRIDTFKGEEQEYIKMKEIPPIASRAISKIEKMKPGNASIINTTNVNLTWTMSGVQNEKMNFSVYVGESKESMVERTTSNYT